MKYINITYFKAFMKDIHVDINYLKGIIASFVIFTNPQVEALFVKIKTNQNHIKMKPNYYKLLMCFYLGMLNSVVFAQSGPAGVSSSANCPLWIKADAGTSSTVHGAAVSNWSDQSGNANHATQGTSNLQPLYQTNVINGMPTLLFDNNTSHPDQLMISDNNNLDNASGMTFYAIVRPLGLGGDVNAIVSKRTGVGSQQAYSWFFYSGSKLSLDLEGNGNRFSTASSFSTSTNYMVSMVFDGSLAAAQRAKQYIGGSLDVTSTESSTSISNHASNLYIGAMNASDGRPFNGHIAEIIVFRKALSSSERKIVDNYLSAKYALTTSSDLFSGDDVAKGNYDFDVAGIGQESDGANSSFNTARGGGVSITSVSGLDNGDYIMTGRNSVTNGENTSDVGGMTGFNNSRWERIWYFDVTNSSTNIVADVQFDASNAGLGSYTMTNASNYVLLYRSGQSGNWTELATGSSVAGSTVTFSGVTISNDGYYSLGTKDYTASPLPAELVSLTGVAFPEGNKLEWLTSTEVNNKGFEIQRRMENEADFTTIDFVEGNNNSASTIAYNYFDTYVDGSAYYRLKQVDFDGKYEFSQIIYVERNKVALPINVVLYPNPVSETLQIKFENAPNSQVEVRVFNSNGQEVKVKLTSTNDYQYWLSVAGMQKGSYTVQINQGKNRFSQRILVK